MNEVILKHIKQLPPLPESAMQIEAVYQNPDASFSDMVKILEKDPLLTADILKAANSPLYGFSREINAISQAVSLFGMGTIRGFALASIVKKSFTLNLSAYAISNNQFSELTKQLHALVSNWYLRKDPKLLGLLSPAAFLVEIGKVIIAQTLISEGREQEFNFQLAQADNALCEADIGKIEFKIYGTNSAKVSATIFDKWKFEENFIKVLEFCDEPEEYDGDNAVVLKAIQSLHVAREAILLNGTMSDESIATAKELVTKYGLDMASFEKAIDTMNEN